MSYLANLTLRLAAGVGSLPEIFRAPHAAYLAAAQSEDGGFAGRRGPSDLYYTSFALRGLAVLGTLEPRTIARAARYLQGRLDQPMPPIDFLSLLISAVLLETTTGIDVFAAAGRDCRQALLEQTEPLRRGDGGYAKTLRGGPSSTYQTFLVAASQQLVGLPVEGAAAMAALVRSRQRPDGGFVEVDRLRHSGTNPTAAAVGLLQILDQLDPATGAASAVFLASMQTAEGGLRAHAQAPVADLLSTFTAVAALGELGALGRIDTPAVQRFVHRLAQPAGGFRGGLWDDAADVEYTFYGLGALGLLAV